MRLKSVKLAGFKSYVDPTILELPHNVTAVVGPNGCGKSNIVDAVRLGIGESQASLLRGDELADVIFVGSDTRAPSGQATIELLFDNHDHEIGGSYAKYSEISLKREIRQDTPSKFFLNGRRCRRKDIHDLFLGSGFGARSYSVIEQGFIGRIVTAKPEELRNHLEEVAGVSKYRERRRETEKKIESTHENLERVKDHATELARQITYLERQAREAARYTDLKDKARTVQAKLVVLQMQIVEDQIEEQGAQMQESSLRVNQELAKLQSIRTALDTFRVREADCLEHFNTIQGKSFETRATLARLEEESRQRKQRRKEATHARQEAAVTKSEREELLTSQDGQISNLRAALTQIDGTRKNAIERCAAAREEFQASRSEADSWRQEWDGFVREFNNNSNVLTLQTEQRTRLLQEFDAIERKNEELDEVLGANDHEDNIEPLQQQKNELEQELQTAVQRAQELDDELEALEQLDIRDEEHRRQLERELREIRERRSALTALIEQTLQRDSSSTQEQTTTLLELQGRPRVGEVIAVQAGYEKAVEVVLNSYLHAITVNRIDINDSAIAELQNSDAVLVAASSHSETGSRLIDVVSKGREFVAEICSQVFIDENLDAALARRKLLKPQESTVTKSGIWLGKTWIKFNGSSRAKNTVLENRTDLQELNKLHDIKENTHQETLQSISVRSQRRTLLREERRVVQQQQRSFNSQLSNLRTKIEQQKLTLYQANVKLANAQQEHETNRVRKLVLEQDIAGLDCYISGLQSETSNLGNKRKELQTKEKENNSALERALLEDRAAQAEFHRLDLEHNKIQGQIASYTLSSELLAKSLEELDHRLQLLEEQIQADEQAARTLETQLADAIKQSAAVDSQLATVRAERDAILHEIRENNVAESQQQQRVDQQQQQTHKLRETHIQLTSKQEHFMSELASLDVDLADVRNALVSSDDEESLTRALNRTQARIEKLGAVNLAAARDLDVRKSEYETYQSRIHDLEVSQDTLKQAMQKIDKETLVLFNDIFTKASDMFQKVFARLFGGGRAELVLTEDDPLTAGVAMLVQPPGKQIKNLSQLSDGEKALAALAFTFAMFKLNPSPICILDEVDAPLDTNNVTRFGKLIHSMANEVQFLIITHSRGTMNFAESLIGITMQEAGVSRVVSVDLE